jgi:hypothetical protein
MLIDRIKISFVHLNTGVETVIFKLPIDECDSKSVEMDELLDKLKNWIQNGKNLYFKDYNQMVVFGNLNINDIGFFKFTLLRPKLKSA